MLTLFTSADNLRSQNVANLSNHQEALSEFLSVMQPGDRKKHLEDGPMDLGSDPERREAEIQRSHINNFDNNIEYVSECDTTSINTL